MRSQCAIVVNIMLLYLVDLQKVIVVDIILLYDKFKD